MAAPRRPSPALRRRLQAPLPLLVLPVLAVSMLMGPAICAAARVPSIGVGEAVAPAVLSSRPFDDRAPAKARALPVVLWHGMGDSCCSMHSMGAIKQLIASQLGVFVHSIATGQGEYGDVWSSFYGNVNTQVDKVCDELAGMEELAGGFNAVGFSQGGQFLRAVVERCGHRLPPVHTLVTLGGQHQGVANTPGCATDLSGAAATACTAMQVLLARGAYAPWVRENLVQAQYFKDPYDLDTYLAANVFLPDVNNEQPSKRQAYADNLAALERLVLFRFDEDTTVVPRDSAWFSFFDGNQTISLFDQPLYTEDWIGLRRLHEAGKLVLAALPGEHMRFTLSAFNEAVVLPYLTAAAGPTLME